MKIGLYIEHGIGDGVGGAELMMTTLASAWSFTNRVDLIHHRPALTKDRLGLFTPRDLSRINVRCLPRESSPHPHPNPLARYRAAGQWHAAVSSGYDVFVACTHWQPPFCAARTGVLLVLFPFYTLPFDDVRFRALPMWKQLRHRSYHTFEWRRRMSTYRHKIAISEYARRWAGRRWRIDCDVVSPPVDVDSVSRPKEPLILSVGRFSTQAHTKKQLEMMEAFRRLKAGGLTEWSYCSVGGLNAREENRLYFERVREAGDRCGARTKANVDSTEVKSLFSRARIFWHATGLGDDTEQRPELAEHFGIATVEAMAAGCVPVVINKGGQREIVEHGTSGFLWDDVQQLERYTRLLVSDTALWTRMSAAARARAGQFGVTKFISRMSLRCGVVTPTVDGGRDHGAEDKEVHHDDDPQHVVSRLPFPPRLHAVRENLLDEKREQRNEEAVRPASRDVGNQRVHDRERRVPPPRIA